MTVIVSVVGEGAVTKTADTGLHAGSFLEPQGQCHVLISRTRRARWTEDTYSGMAAAAPMPTRRIGLRGCILQRRQGGKQLMKDGFSSSPM